MSETSHTVRRWPPSNDFVLLSALLLLATIVGLATTRHSPERLAVYAYYALAAGVGLRVIELAVGDRFADTADRVWAGIDGVHGFDVRSKAVARFALLSTAVGGVGVLVYWFMRPGVTLRPNIVLLYLVALTWVGLRYRLTG